MSTLSGRLSDAIDALRNTDPSEYYEPDERIADALRDKNGFAPTDAAIDVLKAVLFALDRVDELWAKQEFPGVPSVRDYSANVVRFLGTRYNTFAIPEPAE